MFIPTEGSARAVGRVASLTVPGAELAIARHHGSHNGMDHLRSARCLRDEA
jgi:hypothetical protein